ncbi:MAG: hypothetical protein M3P53_01070, partial [Actinomycetota bacterium]|nr:hypothetical protein [Actinomycetota bacterium]
AAAVLAAAAQLDPEPALVARIGPRPPGGVERATWDRAVGAVAVYRARFGVIPTADGAAASWTLGPVRDEDSPSHYARAAEALVEAERAHVGSVPVPALAQERRSLLRTLAAAGPLVHNDALAAAEVARRHLDTAETERDRLAQRLSALSGSRLRRKNRQSLELARQSLASAEHAVAVAEVVVQRAEAALGAVVQRAPDRARIEERLKLIEEVLDRKVAAAALRPAAYVVAAIGEAPDGDVSPAWRAAADRIEGYRHRQLARSPEHGSVVDEPGLVGAIGPRPDDCLDALAWDHVAEFAAPDLVAEQEVAGPDLGW